MSRGPHRLAGRGVELHRERGTPATARLHVNRHLKSGNLDVVELSEGDLIELVATAAAALRVLRRQERERMQREHDAELAYASGQSEHDPATDDERDPRP